MLGVCIGCCVLLGGTADSSCVVQFAAGLGMTNQGKGNFPSIWTTGLFTALSPTKEGRTEDVQAVVWLGFLVRRFCLHVCLTLLAMLLIFLFILFFLVCIFSTGFKGKQPRSTIKSKEPWTKLKKNKKIKKNSACCALGSDLAPGTNFSKDERDKEVWKEIQALSSQSCSWLILKSLSPRDYE